MSNPTHTLQKKIVVFASGSGTNAENIIKFFQKQPNASVVAVFSNKRSAKVLKRAHDLNVKALHFDRDALYNSYDVLHILEDINPDLIVLAGFMWIFPEDILKRFPNKIVNIHPALLPKYGGKGMYGMHVHEAIIQNKEKESGISIHYVNENYDEGEIIFQAKTDISEEDTPESLAEKIHKLEYKHFPEILQQLLQKKSQ
ncbi:MULTISPECIES: phosphoribosylglycinamide formyltransferase [Salegentibacter]|uniref:Phosphoribosylglycinamide formyltransferase n=1 Tax=Salegentibacter agarivorans TaxID=345907 RepID=A0A1I2MB78_9FLAO|nr:MULTISPECIES: phosphoribosylglycinamide formyltransferase [Salegentibacter]APS38058.1 phosphoribosylglycinamide formyltransferase [Salegentibacter sp. T436]SFF88774.1 formyltetrahydrofolate-dependent phosphoribosylglycinamide formyltransferase [Salegentibacter agarivorans]